MPVEFTPHISDQAVQNLRREEPVKGLIDITHSHDGPAREELTKVAFPRMQIGETVFLRVGLKIGEATLLVQDLNNTDLQKEIPDTSLQNALEVRIPEQKGDLFVPGKIHYAPPRPSPKA